LRVSIISHRETSGGAARAAFRLHHSLLRFGVKSRMMVGSKRTDDWTVDGPSSLVGRAIGLMRPSIGEQFLRLQKTANSNLHSTNILPSRLSSTINNGEADVVNLHWVAGETLSIADIGRITKPIVWTFHDMWPFCGAEHVTEFGSGARWRDGYLSQNRPHGDSGLDLDKWTWKRKKNAWKKQMHIICPSRWLAECVRGSSLMGSWDVNVIPNPLDLEVFKPLDKGFCRNVLNLPLNKKIILFGAIGGDKDHNKGYDLLIEALHVLAGRSDQNDVLCCVLGQTQPRVSLGLPFDFQWMGRLHDDATLSLIYNSADVVLVPSRQENLPQSGTEAQACGCPVVAFDVTGLPDVVEHRRTGYLAKPYDTEDLARGIEWVLYSTYSRKRVCVAARNRAEKYWAIDRVVPQYLDVYKRAYRIGHPH